jgi:hypothetical protein
MLAKRVGFFALALAVGLTIQQTGRAQPNGPAAGGKMYTNKQQFRLPFNMSDSDRAKLREVQLYVKSGDEGWAIKEIGQPTQTHFSFHAPHDGEYWFNIVTVDKNGRATPTDVSREAPALIVVVDTQPPEVNVNVPSGTGHGPDECIRCSVHDANADPGTVKVEGQGTDKTWHALEPMPGNPEMFRCPEPGNWTGMVRVTATDRAGNTTVREAGSPMSPTPAAAVAQGPADAATGHTESKSEKATLSEPEGSFGSARFPGPPSPGAGPSVPVPPGPALPAAGNSALPPVPPVAAAGHSEGRDAGAPAAPGSHDTVPSNRQIVNNPNTVLEYRIDQVGPSGVGKVEVWMTSDEGHNWQKLCEDPDKRSPVEFRLPGEGLFGLCLVVTNGLGVGDPPPGKGTAPDYWIEVDMTKPTAQLLSARPGMNEDAGTIFVTWTATDRNLGPEPIDLYYSLQKEGPWQPIARGLKNDGAYRWRAPLEVGSTFYIRLMATDRAGNTTVCDSPQPVLLDMSHPKAVVTGPASMGSKAYSPSGN